MKFNQYPEQKWFTPTSLAEAAYKMVLENKVGTPEFQALINIYGLERIDQLVSEEHSKFLKREQEKKSDDKIDE